MSKVEVDNDEPRQIPDTEDSGDVEMSDEDSTQPDTGNMDGT